MDSDTNLEQIETAQAQKEVTANNNFDAVSIAAIFGRHAEACSGLVWGYYGGRWGGSEIPNGTIALVANATNYLAVDRISGEVQLDDGSPAIWSNTDDYAHLYVIATGPATVSSYEDHRAGPGGLMVGGTGSSAPAPGSITYAMLQSVSATKRVLGRDTAGAGTAEEVSLTQLLDWIGSAAQGDILYRDSSGWARLAAGTSGRFLKTQGAGANPVWAAATSGAPIELQVALSDLLSNLSAGTSKAYLRAPCAFTLTAVRASLLTAAASGTVTVDVNVNGSTILSTKLTIDATEKTSVTAATPAVISSGTIADDDELTFDIDVAGTSARGLIVTLIGTR
jgi:hypothetical protein